MDGKGCHSATLYSPKKIVLNVVYCMTSNFEEEHHKSS